MSNLERVRDLYAAFLRGDHPAIVAHFAPDIDWKHSDGFPNGSHVFGGAAVVATFKMFRDDWEGWRPDLASFVDGETTIVVLGTYRGVYKRTGRAIAAEFAHVLDMRDGLVVKWRQHTDTAQFARVMGL
jgi:ketosteroid isomerase-like protein